MFCNSALSLSASRQLTTGTTDTKKLDTGKLQNAFGNSTQITSHLSNKIKPTG
jgi:hypothetical protein